MVIVMTFLQRHTSRGGNRKVPPLGVWDSAECVGPHSGSWTSLGCWETKGPEASHLFPTLELGACCLVVIAIGVLIYPNDGGSCSRGFLELNFSKGRATGLKRWENSDPHLPPMSNGDENTSPTGSLRTLSDTHEQAPWPYGYCGIMNAYMDSGLLRLSNFVIKKE